MSDSNASADALDTTSLLADTTAVPQHDDRSEPLTSEQCAIVDIRSANAVDGRCWGQSHQRAVHARDGREGVEVTELANDPPAVMLGYAVEGPPGPAKTRADMGSAVASGVVVLLREATDMTVRARQKARPRAQANAARFSESVTKPPPAKTGNQLVDALALLGHEADKRRFYAWDQLAKLRAAACKSADGWEVACARKWLAEELRRLNTLAARRRQALRDGGATEVGYHWWMRRSHGASWMTDLYLERARFQNDCLWTEASDAACELISIQEVLNLLRADAWGHLADSYKRRAEGLPPDPDRIADLRYCRVRIVELNAQYRAAESAAKAETDAPESEGSFNNVAADASLNSCVLRVRHAEAFASSARGAVALSAMQGDDDVPW
jgi:hypothetical protein